MSTQCLDSQSLTHEHTVLSTPYSVDTWLSYIEFTDSLYNNQFNTNTINLYNRALQLLPYSYKLWHHYLSYLIHHALINKHKSRYHQQLSKMFYTQCLTVMSKYPLIWCTYIDYLIATQLYITEIRHCINTALHTLPITQHIQHIWPIVLRYVHHNNNICPVPTGIHFYKRYLILVPIDYEHYVDYLLGKKQYELYVDSILYIVKQTDFMSIKQKTKLDYFNELIDCCIQHSNELSEKIDVEHIFKEYSQYFQLQSCTVWLKLVEYYLGRNDVQHVDTTYNTAIASVMTINDFSIIYDSYTKYLESCCEIYIEQLNEVTSSVDTDTIDTKLQQCISKLDELVDNRDILINDVLLRQNNQSVQTWKKRIQLLHKHNTLLIDIIKCYGRALKTIDVQNEHYTNDLHTLWIQFAELYNKHGDHTNCVAIYQRALTVPYESTQCTITVYCSYYEYLIQRDQTETVYKQLRDLLTVPKDVLKKQNNSAILNTSDQKTKLYYSTKLWSLYLDLDYMYGTNNTHKYIINQLFQLRIISIAQLMNHIHYLHTQHYYEQIYQLCERGIALLHYPEIHILYITYIRLFVKRYGSSKVYRCRQIYDSALQKCQQSIESNKSHAYHIELYLLYVQYELQYGKIKFGMRLMSRCVELSYSNDMLSNIDIPQQFGTATLYILYTQLVLKHYGLIKTRSIFTELLESCPTHVVTQVCMKFIELEVSVGEIDRTRALYQYCAAYSDPRVEVQFWSNYNEFELQYGNIDTFKDMIRTKRLTTAQYAHITVPIQKQQQFVKSSDTSLGEKPIGNENGTSNEQGNGSDEPHSKRHKTDVNNSNSSNVELAALEHQAEQHIQQQQRNDEEINID